MVHLIKQGLIEGIRLFFWTFSFFYRHLPLVFLSLIPSTFRVLQSWSQFQTPIWMEVIVELSRVILFFLIIVFMMNKSIIQLFQKNLWLSIQKQIDLNMRRNWPYVTIGQMIIFILCLYGLMNLLFILLINKETVQIFMNMLHIDKYHVPTTRDSLLFFIKNMSIIPMSMVYLLRMLGIGTIKSEV